MCLSLVFLDDMIYDTLVIINFIIVWTCEFFVRRWWYLSLYLMHFHHVQIMLLGHLLVEDLYLVECFFKFCVKVSVSRLQAIHAVMVGVPSVH